MTQVIHAVLPRATKVTDGNDQGDRQDGYTDAVTPLGTGTSEDNENNSENSASESGNLFQYDECDAGFSDGEAQDETELKTLSDDNFTDKDESNDNVVEKNGGFAEDANEEPFDEKNVFTSNMCKTEGGEDSVGPEQESGNSSTHFSVTDVVSMSNENKKFRECTVCGKPFVHRSSLIKHMRIHTGEKPFQCDMCEKSFRQTAHLKDHLLTHTGERAHQCDECGKEFTVKSSLIKHLRKFHRVEPLKCSKCKVVFVVDKNFKNHIRTCGSEILNGCRDFKQFNTVESEWSTDDKDRSDTDTMKQNAESLCQYDLCEEGFETKSDLKEDLLQTHCEEKSHQCAQCNKSFTLKSSLAKHVRVQHGENPYQCAVCGESFSFKGKLRRHMTAEHSSDKPYQCDQCGRSFTQKGNMVEHMWTHSEETPYQCDQCNRCFGSKHRLERHVATHSGDKPHQCNKCEMSFLLKQGLTRHLLTHNTEKPHQCDYCGKSFMTERYLSQHMVIHTVEKPHSCNMCGESFSFSSALSTHRHKHCAGKR